MILFHGADAGTKASIEAHGLRESERGLGVWMSPTLDVARYTIWARRGHRIANCLKQLRHGRDTMTTDELLAGYADLKHDLASGTAGVVVTLELPDDFPFRYREARRFGYCTDVGHVPTEHFVSVEDVEITRDDGGDLDARFGGFEIPDLTPAERERWAADRRRWVGAWPKHF